jgi:hypothetical protein
MYKNPNDIKKILFFFEMKSTTSYNDVDEIDRLYISWYASFDIRSDNAGKCCNHKYAQESD